MQRLILITLWIFSLTGLFAQSYTLTINGGYGSGTYLAGDTVHIWSEEYDTSKTFSTWTGDTQYLENLHEWHTTLVMPNQNVNLTTQIDNMPAYTISYEQIMGANNLKNVYYHFPVSIRGVIYLFHGTGGNASNWVKITEYRSFINAAIADSFGIIITEAEEITLNTDLNADGNLRWLTFPIDTINGIDYLNIKAITDTFVSRGYITNTLPKFSVGMSNGGSFSNTISYAFNYVAGISYCASSAQPVFAVRNNPFAFRMALFDDNAEVGPQGNYEAWQNDSTLSARGVCHDYLIHDKQPIYPERFARVNGISVGTSQAIFNELLNNGQLDVNNYALHSDTIKNHILASPGLYPTIIGLSSAKQVEALNQIAASNAEHKFYSDYNWETLDFINHLCSSTTGIENNPMVFKKISVYPNPTADKMNVRLPDEDCTVYIYTDMGKLVFTACNRSGLTSFDVSQLPAGMYLIRVTSVNDLFTERFIHQ